MRLFVIGATGKTGTEILDLARAHGHEVTAFVRSPEKLAALNGVSGVNVIKGDPLKPEAVAAALRGHDAVLSVLGPPPRQTLRPCTLMQDSGRSTVAAMSTAGVSRLAILSAAVLFPEKGLLYAFFRRLLRHHARDLMAMEEIVRASGLAWTIARPPRLTGGNTVSYRAEVDARTRGARFSLTHRSVAAFMLDAIEQRSHVGQVVGLG
jgi:uncharacterized protein YbjT (DUF2867 family)